jgi:16S rRNA (guanine527-N7)-methyltransferase
MMSSAEEIRSAGESAGVALDEGQAAALGLHLEMVLSERLTVNLVAESTVDDALRLHVVDSLLARDMLSGCSGLIDIGSGAGFPGIPLGVALRVPTVLVESRHKKAAFLGRVAQALSESGFSIEVECERAEDPDLISRRCGVDAVVARAVSGLPTLVELAAPLLSSGGAFVAHKGLPSEEELERGNEVARIVGMSEAEVFESELPGGDESRCLVRYVKQRDSQIDLPRRKGRASKSPLA